MYFTSNHDENSWNGTVYERLGNGAKAFAVLTTILNGMPLIYSGEEPGLNKRLAFFEKDNIEWKERPFKRYLYKITKFKEKSCNSAGTGERGNDNTDSHYQ